ncbi:MAG: HAD hydrolase-like protein [Gemmatimonadaceae bacterium]|nr:HAD hydrolase-like protein [Gemmatimonadaceae bacterium]
MADIQWIFFDIGGVLGTNGWDTAERQRAVEKFGIDGEEFRLRHIEGVGPWEEGRIGIDEYLDLTIFYCPRNFTREQFKELMFAESQPFPDSIAVAREVAALARYTMMTLNNEAAELNTYRIDTFGLDPIFEAFMSSCWLGSRKPMKKIYTDALSIAQAVPTKTLFIDDRERNLVPARELGLNTLLFQSAAQLRSDLNGILEIQLKGV